MSGPWITAFVALVAVVVMLAIIVLGLLRRVGSLLEDLEQLVRQSATGGVRTGLGVGGKVADFNAPTRTGEFAGLPDIVSGATTGLVAFLDPSCGYCETIMSELAEEPWDIDNRGLAIVITDSDEARARNLEHFGVKVLYQRENTVGRAFDTTITPCAFVVDADGFVIANTIPRSVADLRTLATESTGVNYAPA